MARKRYEHENIIQIFTILGAIVGIATIILGFTEIDNYAFYQGIGGTGDLVMRIIIAIVGLVICVITLLVGWKPRTNNLLPLHWLVLFILAILLIVFGAGLWACILVIIGALIALIDDLS
jgi:hypothetical protein